jgi:hypothetical protein
MTIVESIRLALNNWIAEDGRRRGVILSASEISEVLARASILYDSAAAAHAEEVGKQ